MRVGSIGSSYVPKINAKRGQATPSDSSQSTPSFKADVRFLPTHPWGPDEMPPEHALPMIKVLEHAKTAYKDWGSDNIIVYLEPYISQFGDTKKKNLASCVRIYYGYKDVEVARKEILENREKDRYKEHDYNIEALKNHEPEVMENLKNIDRFWPDEYIPKRDKDSSLIKKLDETMECAIKCAKYTVPNKIKTIEFEKSYDPKTYEPTPWWIKAMG